MAIIRYPEIQMRYFIDFELGGVLKSGKNDAIDNIIRNLKSNDFPTFKNEYEDIIKKLIELVENNSKALKELKEIKRENYTVYLSLPMW